MRGGMSVILHGINGPNLRASTSAAALDGAHASILIVFEVLMIHACLIISTRVLVFPVPGGPYTT